MRVYLSGAFEHCNSTFGYGTAAAQSFNAFKELGVDVVCRRPEDGDSVRADFEIAFTHPSHYRFYCESSFKIGFTAWESTQWLPGWVEGAAVCDEIWTPSQWNKDIFKPFVGGKDICVYPHGISKIFSPRRVKFDGFSKDRPFTFLFVGEPAVRKDGQRVVDTFLDLYGGDDRFRLIVKGSNSSTVQTKAYNGVAASPELFHSNVLVITDMYSEYEMVSLYAMADVFVYPSWGEGFGFNPLQAMAMGIPTICTDGWAEYGDYITAPLGSTWATSPWQSIHPGLMLRPDHTQLREYMHAAPAMHDEWSKIAFKNALQIHREYDWVKVTRPMVARLRKIYKNM